MPRVSGTSNPTNLRKIARKHVSLSPMEVNGRKAFQVKKLDFATYTFSGTEKVILVARAGNTSRRYELGTVANWSQSTQMLDGLDFSKPLRFRLLIRSDASPRLIASAENLRCSGDGDMDGLFPIVAADLGQRLWRLTISEDGPELHCNERIFPTGPSALHYPPFWTIVLPEAVRQILEYLAKDPERINGDDSMWKDWGPWLQSLNIEIPPPQEEEFRQVWVEESTARFCDKHKAAEELQAFLAQEGAS